MPTGGSGRKAKPEFDYLSNILKSADRAYQNAMKISDMQNARIEHDTALERAVIDLPSDHTELFRQFGDNPSFKKWLSETIFAST